MTDHDASNACQLGTGLGNCLDFGLIITPKSGTWSGMMQSPNTELPGSRAQHTSEDLIPFKAYHRPAAWD